MFSSVSAIVGTPGQASYAAANGFMDAFVHYRRSMGLAGLSINWGRLGEVGYVSRNQSVEESLERRGFYSISPAEATAALERLLLMDTTQAIFGRMDWRKATNGTARYSRLDSIGNQAEDEAQKRGHIRALIMERPQAEQAEMLRTYIRHKVSKVLGLAPERLDISARLNDMGLDSLMSVELVNQLENDLDISYRSNEMMQQPTTQTMIKLALKQLEIYDAGDGMASKTHDNETGEQDCLVALQKGSDEAPALYCLHAIDGKLDIYSDMADALPNSLPLVGIHSAWLAGERPQRLGLDELINQYVENIMRQQPTGPYHLAGFSYGGLLALLTAHRLEQQGAEVAFVALLDSNPAWIDTNVAQKQIFQDLLDEVYSRIQADQDTRGLPGLELGALVEKLKTTETNRRSEVIKNSLLGNLELDQAKKLLLGDLIDSIEYHSSLIEELALPRIKAVIYSWETRPGVTDDRQQGERWAAHSLTGCNNELLDCEHWALMDAPNIQPIAENLADLMQKDTRCLT